MGVLVLKLPESTVLRTRYERGNRFKGARRRETISVVTSLAVYSAGKSILFMRLRPRSVCEIILGSEQRKEKKEERKEEKTGTTTGIPL